MADISLREYLEKVDALLKTGKSDEVVLHTRHILQRYPKNAATNRLLGQALVRGSNFREAEAALRRVLAVYPDDEIAHSVLSEMNDRQGKADAAIWHLERALESNPNSPTLLDRLRQLYQRHRKIDDPHFQLTTGAVARQYIRNGLYAQAIDTLQTTLEKSPRRVDLRLLLAQTMWDAGMQVEAAETALDVLDTLPYCLEANRVLTLLWLDEGRPSDAQRYLNQIQDADPYLALELVQGVASDDSAFSLQELDYRRIAETQVTSAQPDWLTEIDDPAAAATVIDQSIMDTNTALEDELPEAFLTDLDGDDEAMMTIPSPTAPRASSGTGLTGLLAALDRGDEADDADELPDSGMLPDWLMESAPQKVLGDDVHVDAESDPMAWLESEDTALATEDIEAVLDLDSDEDVESALDWLQQPDDQAAPDFFADVPSDSAPHHDDALSWMQASGIEMLDESEMPPASALIDDEEEMVYQDPTSIDPLAWLGSSSVELIDDAAASNTQVDLTGPLPDADPLAWLEDDDTSILPGQEPAEPSVMDVRATVQPNDGESLDWLQRAGLEEVQPDTGFFSSLPDQTIDDDNLDWLHDDSLLDEILDLESLSDPSPQASALPMAQAVEAEQPADFFDTMIGSTQVTDMLPDIGSADETPETEDQGIDWQSAMADNEHLEPEDADFDDLEWLDEQPAAASESEGANAELGWMSEQGGEQPEWLTTDPEERDEEEAVAGEAPDWLVEEQSEGAMATDQFGWLAESDDAVAAEAEPVETAAAQASDSFGWFDEEATDAEPADSPDWLNELETTEETSSALQADDDAELEPADLPEWLAGAQPVTEAEETINTAAQAGDSFDWLDEEESAAEPAADAGWLTEIEAEAEGEFEPDAVTDSSMWVDEGESEIEPADLPNWLTGAPAAGEDEDMEAVAEQPAEAFDWAEDEEEQAAEPAADADWLAALQPIEATMSEGEFEYEAEAEESELAPADLPDWLTGTPSSEDDEIEVVAEQSGQAFDWAEEDEAEAAAEPTAEMPEWLTAMESEAAAESEYEAVAEESELASADLPDWLTGAPAASEDEAIEAVGEQSAEGFDWAEDELEAEPAADADWLAALQPAEAIDSEDAFEIEAEAAASELASADLPDWLTGAPSSEDEEMDAVAEQAAEAFDWVEEDEAEAAAEPAAMPEWLASMEPEASIEGEFEPEFEDASAPDPDLPEWPEEAEPEDEPEVYRPAATIAQTRILPENDFDWPGDEDEPAAEEPVYEDSEFEIDYEAEPARSQFGWLEEAEAAERAADEFEETGEAMLDEASEFVYEADDESEEKILAAANMPPPADNAPDWLNAMVPGLDLDYQAIENDQPIESTYVESPARRHQPDSAPQGQPAIQADWLADIVDEETSPMRAIQSLPVETGRQRFVFTRKPPWLRALTEKEPSSESAEQDDDFELPDWLR